MIKNTAHSLNLISFFLLILSSGSWAMENNSQNMLDSRIPKELMQKLYIKKFEFSEPSLNVDAVLKAISTGKFGPPLIFLALTLDEDLDKILKTIFTQLGCIYLMPLNLAT